MHFFEFKETSSNGVSGPAGKGSGRAAFKDNATMLPAGAVAAANFNTCAADPVSQDGKDFFIFQFDKHQPWKDPTGCDTAGDALLIATLQSGATMTNLDVVMFWSAGQSQKRTAPKSCIATRMRLANLPGRVS